MAASEAVSAGYGGIAAVAAVTGIAPSTIGRGIEELSEGEDRLSGRVRRLGGGRKPTIEKDPTLLVDLQALIEPTSRGDSERPLRWTCKSLRRLAGELQARGHRVSHTLVGDLLESLDYSLQANRKTREGDSHPDRDAQFGYINARWRRHWPTGEPAISVDTKKKELVGDFKNAGREYRPRGDPEPVRVHDFMITELGRAAPYGVYDMAANAGWVNVGIDHDTAAFAVNSDPPLVADDRPRALSGRHPPRDHRRRRRQQRRRVRLWKRELQALANEIGSTIDVQPPAARHQQMEQDRASPVLVHHARTGAARPLVSYQVIVQLIAATTTNTGLTVHCELDQNRYPKGITVSDADMATINISRADFHGEWNYTISPSSPPNPALIL